MKRFSLLLAACLFAGTALAATHTVTWVNPTQRTDGTSLPASSITSTKVEWGTCSGTAFGTVIGTASTVGAATSLTYTTTGVYGNICTHAYSNTAGGTSAASNVAIKIVPESPPGAPVITVTTVAYELRDSWWRGPRMVSVGTIALGSTCFSPYLSNPTYATVDRADVTITRKYRGGQLYGNCA